MSILITTPLPSPSLFISLLSLHNIIALYTAQVCAGLMGGFWIVVVVLEYIQLRKLSEYYASEKYEHESSAYNEEYNQSNSTAV